MGISIGITLSGATLTGGVDSVDFQITQYATPRSFRGYTAVIDYAGPGYMLTITGSGAPGPMAYDTFRNAQNGFRIFLLDKPES